MPRRCHYVYQPDLDAHGARTTLRILIPGCMAGARDDGCTCETPSDIRAALKVLGRLRQTQCVERVTELVRGMD